MDICERMGFPPSLYPSPADGSLLNQAQSISKLIALEIKQEGGGGDKEKGEGTNVLTLSN